MTTRAALHPVRVAKPAELARIPHDRSAVIEASAGTGKTYLIERLVVDLLLTEPVDLPSILVVTFTDKATLELRARLRQLLATLAAPRADEEPPPAGAPSWTLDAGAIARLTEARRTFPQATISTIHAFCQRVLMDHAFAGGRLLNQRQIDSREIFATAFRDALRRTLARDDDLRPWLEAYLRAGNDVSQLETLLAKLRGSRLEPGRRFDPERLREAVAAFLAVPQDEPLVRALKKDLGAKASGVVRRMETLRGALDAHRGSHAATLLAAIDAAEDQHNDGLFCFIEERLEGRDLTPLSARLGDRFRAVAAAAVPLASAVAQVCLPHVQARLRELKQERGLFDFDDMLLQVAETLDGPGGDRLAEQLRRQFRFAIIDEFQDTDDVQWRIFRKIFGAAGSEGARPIYLIGDPKQAIYAFRGADVGTYLEARDEIARGTPPVVLDRCFRAAPNLIAAQNRILDQRAPAPLFATGAVRYDHPVTCGRPDAPAMDPPVVAFALPVGAGSGTASRRTHLGCVVREVQRLVEGDVVPASEIFVLTRAGYEAREVAAGLAAAGVPFTLSAQSELLQTEEAAHIRDLLDAIDRPQDTARRLRAWMTPFFGLDVSDLARSAELPPAHPLHQRLFAWKALADSGHTERLFAAILDDSGVLRRELCLSASERRLTDYQHVFELLLGEMATARVSLRDLVRKLDRFVGRDDSMAEDGNRQRVDTERTAVQVMTMHAAKGLEADVVFLFGGCTKGKGSELHAYRDGRRRKAWIGRTRERAIAQAISRERDAEDERLLYVALTRARRRLYLPCFMPPDGDSSDSGETLAAKVGGYSPLNRRLLALRAEAGGSREIHFEVVAGDPEPVRATAARERLAAWTPETCASSDGDALPRHPRGVAVTSFSRLKARASRTFTAGDEVATGGRDLDLAAAVPRRSDAELPPGAASGVFLHALLERVPLDTVRDGRDAESWAATPTIRELLAAVARQHDIDRRHLGHAARLVHAALATPLPLPGTNQRVALAETSGRVLREMDFLFPAGERLFVTGFIDAVFEHDGRLYFADWKSDALPSWDALALAGHVRASYDLQARIYAIAVLRAFGLNTREDFERRLGGFLYVFLRGLPDAIHAERPGFEELTAAADALGRMEVE